MTILAALDYLTLIVHVIVCVLLIGIVLIQGGKGASMSASFGMGAASTAFGARTDSFMTKLTSGAAITFVITSLGLTFLRTKTGSISQQINVPASAVPETPSVPQDAATNAASSESAQAASTVPPAANATGVAPAASESPAAH